jgi:uncharacterized membrane protein
MRQHSRILVVKSFFMLAILIFAAGVSAHTGHKKKSQTQTSALPQTSESTPPPQNVEEPPQSDIKPTAEPGRDEREIMKEAVASHMHNKIVHFPLALGFAAAIFFLLGAKWPEYRTSARLLLVMAAVFAIAAYFTGRAQEEPFEEGEMKPFLELHRNMGITTAIVLWVGVLLTSLSQNKKLTLLYAIILLLLVGVTGFFGGILAHG